MPQKFKAHVKHGKVKFRIPERSFAMSESVQIEPKDLNFPKSVYESLARTLYPNMLEYFKDEDNKKAFEEWLLHQK